MENMRFERRGGRTLFERRARSGEIGRHMYPDVAEEPARRSAVDLTSFGMNIVYTFGRLKKRLRVTATSARYRVTAFAISLAALAYVQRVAISQAAEGIQADLNLGKAQLGLIFGAFGLSYALF